MRLGSSAISDGGRIPRRFTCEGADLSPPLEWSEAPEETRSYVLLCDDPDAPSGPFHHWALYDIPRERTALGEGQDRAAVAFGFKQAVNDFNRLGYGGPCPPRGHGPHRYRFKLLALTRDELPVEKGPSCRDVERAARKWTLAEAGFVATYER